MSRNLCCVKSCNNTKYEKPKLSFHNFPTKEPERLQKWVEFCENETITNLLETNNCKLEHKAICSEHFEDNKYNNPMKKIRLMCNALPTIKPNQKKRTALPIPQQNRPPVQVIPAQLLLRTDLSRSWRMNRQKENQNQNESQANESSELTQIRNIFNQNNNESQQREPEVKSNSNPIIKHYSDRHLRYENEIKNLREKLKKSKKQVMNLRYRLKRTNPIGNTRKSKLNYIIKCIKGLSEETLNPVMSEMIEYHLISAFLNKSRVQKWTNRMKKFCADLYHKSPTAYCFLQKTITLPTKKTILKFTEDRIQSAKEETFRQTTSCDTTIETTCDTSNVTQLIANFTEQPVIQMEPIDELLIPNELIEYNSNERVNEEIIDNNVIDLEAISGENVIKSNAMTTQIIFVEKLNPLRTYTRAKE